MTFSMLYIKYHNMEIIWAIIRSRMDIFIIWKMACKVHAIEFDKFKACRTFAYYVYGFTYFPI